MQQFCDILCAHIYFDSNKHFLTYNFCQLYFTRKNVSRTTEGLFFLPVRKYVTVLSIIYIAKYYFTYLYYW